MGESAHSKNQIYLAHGFHKVYTTNNQTSTPLSLLWESVSEIFNNFSYKK